MTAAIEETLYLRFGCEYAAGSVIFSEDEEGRLVYIIQSGRVEISKAVGEKSKVLAVLSRGEFFGEMALISERPRMATARALEECRLLAIDSATFYKILRSDYDITLRIIEQLATRLAEADRRLEVLLFTDATSRLIRLLEGIPPPGGWRVEHVAYELGVPTERMQRIIGKFEEKGIVKADAGGLTVADQAKLAKLKNYVALKDEFGQIE
jgi:CRP/FNR family cyclic AMP-dependent transcriptional regulator